MQAKNFLLLLIGVLVLGAGFGGAFAGGIALGKGQQEELPLVAVQPAASSDVGRETTGQTELLNLSQIREQFQSGEIDPETLAQLREQFQGRVGQGGQGGQGFAGGGLIGTIGAINGTLVTVDTAQGPLQATVGADTTIQMFSEGELTDLETGLRVMVTGQRDEEGNVVASSILITPEGVGDAFGGGQRPR
jgi:hypothetical protein